MPQAPSVSPPSQNGIILDPRFDPLVCAQPADQRALADVLIRILVGESSPDLSALPAEQRQAVQGLLARLGGA